MTLVFIVGQSQTGKTWLSNHLADVYSLNEYHETQGVRILEITKSIKNINVNVELWDVSGNPKFHSLLSGVSKEAAGVIFIGSDSKIWESLFSHLSPSQVLIISKNSLPALDAWKNASIVQGVSLDESSLVKLKLEFDKFLLKLVNIQQEKKEKEESLILES